MQEDRRAVWGGRLFAGAVACLIAGFPVGLYCGLRIMSEPSEWWLVPYLALFLASAVMGFASGWRDGRLLGMVALLCAVLFGLAGPAAVGKYRRVQIAEAVVIVPKLSESLEEKLSADDPIPGLDTAWTPQARCCEGGGGPHGRCSQQAHSKLWRSEPWLSLGFQGPDFDFRYQYRIVRRGPGYVIQAKGDNDCDGVTSLFELGVARDAQGTWGHGFFNIEREVE